MTEDRELFTQEHTDRTLEPLQMVEQQLEEVKKEGEKIPTRAELDIAIRRMKRTVRVIILVGIAAVAIVLLFGGWLFAGQAEVQNAGQINRLNIETIQRENAARAEKGLPPIPVPEITNPSEIDVDATINARIAAFSDALRNDPNLRGLAGEDGDAGLKGDKGDKGDRGEKGEKGDKGDTGNDGRNGTDGINGTNGTDGSPGQSLPGPPGNNGTNGTDGQNGRGVLDFGPEVVDGQCVFVTRYDQPPLFSTKPANPVFCAVPEITPPAEIPQTTEVQPTN